MKRKLDDVLQKLDNVQKELTEIITGYEEYLLRIKIADDIQDKKVSEHFGSSNIQITRHEEKTIDSVTDNGSTLQIVYCDGACENNGSSYVRACRYHGSHGASIAIWFAKDDPRNFSQLLRGRQTINISELEAIRKTLEFIEKDREYEIRTDSLYSINVLNGTWKAKKNIKLIENIKSLINERKVTLKWIKRNSEIGNVEADKLSHALLND